LLVSVVCDIYPACVKDNSCLIRVSNPGAAKKIAVDFYVLRTCVSAWSEHTWV
jgi:hypothetical protein